MTTPPTPAAPRPVELRFISSPYADYLFYLFYRDETRVPAMKAVPLEAIPTLEPLIALPEMVASGHVHSYQDIFPLLDAYRAAPGRVATSPVPRILAYSHSLPEYEQLRSIVARGEEAFPAFLKLWEEHVHPEEERNIQVWKEQATRCEPMLRLQALTRLRFPASSLDVASILFHLSGSANYTPPGVYSGTFKQPNLPWTLGHEATHLLVDVHVGANWQQHPSFPKVMARARAAGLEASDLEEALALLMQVKLAQECGTKPREYRLSAVMDPEVPTRSLLIALEDGWESYLSNSRRWPTIIDYLLDRALMVLKS